MVVIKNENTAFFDVDETLIIPCDIHEADLDTFVLIFDERINKKLYFNKYVEHIDLLKQMKARGRYIVVWSAGGFAWAQKVIEVLGLIDVVDLVMTKPGCYVDDKDANCFMERVYFAGKGGRQ